MTQHKKPCGDCPFRRVSTPNHLGASTPEEFVATALADVPMPCHLTIDYDDPEWKEKWLQGQEGKFCAGSLVFAANMCKLSRDPARPKLPADREKVFSWPAEFLKHHSSYQQEEEHGSKRKAKKGA